MKKVLGFCTLFIPLVVTGQYTAEEIKKYKIYKIAKLSVTTGAEGTAKEETWYDGKGNDSAEYVGGTIYRQTKYEYNGKGQVISRTRYDAKGKETETSVYDYKADGSYTINNTDSDFGVTDIIYYDQRGRIQKTISPDKTEKTYTYNSKGKLVSVKSKPGNGNLVINIQYTYNTKGQLIKIEGMGENKWTQSYRYNNKGLISTSRNITVTDGHPDPEVRSSFEYEFRP